MSKFEYITVLTSLVVAVGVSQLISGWGRLYLNRSEARPYALQAAVSVLLLVALLQSTWGYWGFRDASWDFFRFMLALAPLLPIVGASYLILPRGEGPTGSSRSPRDHYFAVHRVVFLLLAAWIALGTIAELALVEPELHLGQGVRLVATILLLALAFTRRPSLHWAGMALLAILQLLFVLFVTPVLD